MARRIRKEYRPKGIVMVAGHFHPLHVGHIRMIEEAQKLGNWLTLVVCNDYQAKMKRSKIFMPAEDRAKIMGSIRGVDQVVIAEDTTSHVSATIRKLRPDIFANGCDEKHPDLKIEMEVCKELGIKVALKVGGSKIRSSSDILKEYVS